MKISTSQKVALVWSSFLKPSNNMNKTSESIVN